jgi:hypothetical protein
MSRQPWHGFLLVASVLSLCSPAPRAGAAPGEESAGKKSDRERALEWVRDNNAFGPEHKLVKDVKAHLESLQGGHGFKFEMGAGLVKSGKPAVLLGWRRGFWVFELSAKEVTKVEKCWPSRIVGRGV